MVWCGVVLGLVGPFRSSQWLWVEFGLVAGGNFYRSRVKLELDRWMGGFGGLYRPSVGLEGRRLKGVELVLGPTGYQKGDCVSTNGMAWEN